MKTFVDILKDSNQKTLNKVATAFEQSGSKEYMASFIAEATGVSATDFPKVGCMITNNYICAYSTLMRMSYKILVFPLSQVTNIYRSNMSIDNVYDFTGFYLFADMADGSKKQLAFNARKGNKVDMYDELIGCFKNRKRTSGEEV